MNVSFISHKMKRNDIIIFIFILGYILYYAVHSRTIDTLSPKNDRNCYYVKEYKDSICIIGKSTDKDLYIRLLLKDGKYYCITSDKHCIVAMSNKDEDMNLHSTKDQKHKIEIKPFQIKYIISRFLSYGGLEIIYDDKYNILFIAERTTKKFFIKRTVYINNSATIADI